MKTKYTHDSLKEVIDKSFSFLDVLRNLNLKQSGGSHVHIQKLVKIFNIDTSHFHHGHPRGVYRGGGNKPLKPQEILINNRNNRREKASVLRKALLKFGIKENCFECGTGTVWNNKPLTLQIDHRNGNSYDNRVENLRFLCPSCHSQTDTFGVKNIKEGKL